MSEEQSSGRLEALDGLRGIAALGVVVWHYQHFGGEGDLYPYRHAFFVEWLYEKGWLLVDLFFVLSGCVFTHRYLRPISERQVRPREFFILRVSRLYPLHVFTLLMVAGLQWYRMAHHRPALLYPMNDLYHFVLNLTFLQVSGLELGAQYNNPSWSVAVEVFVYVIFWNLARTTRYAAASLGLVLWGLGVYRMGWTFPFANEYVARGVMGFFLGSLLLLGLRRAGQAGLATRTGIVALVALVGVAVVARWIGYDAFVLGAWAQGGRIVPPHVVVVFPLVLTVALTLGPVRRILALRPLRYLGDISYTVYLLHVPLQMVILAAFDWRGTKLPTSDPRFFWSFVATTVVLATVTHHYMEVPARRRIRQQFLQTRT